MKNEIFKFVIGKGEVRSISTNFELLDLHSNYDSNKLTLTTIGG